MTLGAEAYADALAEHRRVIREACAAEGGVEVDTQGDAFFFAFPTAPGALAAAAALTEALAPGPDPGPRRPAHGHAARDRRGLRRRRRALRRTSRSIRRTAAKSCSRRRHGDARRWRCFTDLGEHRLKDIEGAVSIYQLGDRDLPAAQDDLEHEPPAPASSFVGREHELREVLATLRARDTRFCTLTGPGGSGKTRLAVQAAATLVPFVQGRCLLGRARSLREPSLVTDTIAQTLGAKDGLAEHIAEREMLLLLDNLEQVIEAAPALVGARAGVPQPDALRARAGSSCACRARSSTPYLRSPPQKRSTLFCERSGARPPHATRSPSSAPGSTTFHSRSSSPPPARGSSRPSSSSNASPSASTC